jgi:hypothetical protein
VAWPRQCDYDESVATVDLEMKRKAIEQARPIDHATTGIALWRTDGSILKWLESL